MRRLQFAFFLLMALLASVVLYAQATRVISSGTLPSSCSAGAVYVKTGSAAGWYICQSSAWVGPFPSSSTGAPTDAQYWTGAADSTLSVEKNLGALSTGLVINTSGTPTAFTGSTCAASNFATSIDASGALTCGVPSGAGTVTNTGTLTSGKVIIGNGSADITVASTTGIAKLSSGTLSAATAGTDYVAPGGIGATNVIVAASDDSDSDNTVHDDPELLFAVTTSAVYQFEAVLFFTTGTSATPDVKVGFAIPTSATMTAIWEGLAVGATTADGQWTFRAQNQSSTPVPARATGVISTSAEAVTPVRITGIVRTGGTAGTVQLQFAQNTTTGGTPTVRETDSFIRYTRVQ